MIQIKGADKMEKSIRLFVPNQNEGEKSASQILLDKLSSCLEGFTVTAGKGTYKMKATNTLISEDSLVIDISLTENDGLVKQILSLLKEYGISAREETIMFNLDGVSYISEPDKLEVS